MRPSRSGPALVASSHFPVVIEAILLVLAFIRMKPGKLMWPGCGPKSG